MASKDDLKSSEVLEDRGRILLGRLPSANCIKPLTPFSIEDILSKPSVRKSSSFTGAAGDKLPAAASRSLWQTSPLCALEELARNTLLGLEVSGLQTAGSRDSLTLFDRSCGAEKRRKSRTAFTNHQVYELERRFLYQKYLSPADRDQISQQLGLTNAQVITWFQNRRAKLKRDLEEMKADVESARAAGAVAREEPSSETD
ncbi:transcription factor LBX1a [Parambassis ranga]|uniref:Transcription factor LBX1a n=1 Tax=Parambassis ranga TaxID=210632 RepID=A0A6P7JRJ5_9TELE|nr:transcription factor LBX1-like [Parambassis ranga]